MCIGTVQALACTAAGLSAMQVTHEVMQLQHLQVKTTPCTVCRASMGIHAVCKLLKMLFCHWRCFWRSIKRGLLLCLVWAIDTQVAVPNPAVFSLTAVTTLTGKY